jgi:hypothetical protein
MVRRGIFVFECGIVLSAKGKEQFESKQAEENLVELELNRTRRGRKPFELRTAALWSARRGDE